MSEEKDTYEGPERRTGKDRRVSTDRRDMIRFEPDKDDRRKQKERRKKDVDMWERRDI